jgi:hypothetical protein
VASFDAEILVNQLAQLGRDLSAEVAVLGTLEDLAVENEGRYRKLDEEHEDAVATAFLAAEGSAEVRRNAARLKAVPSRLFAEDAWMEWKRACAKLRTQQANIQALHRRVEIGRSMLSREKALLSLSGVGET